MPIYDYSCKACGNTHEAVRGVDVSRITCPVCGKQARRVISLSGTNKNTMSEYSPEFRYAAQMADPKGIEPETKEFRKNPARSTMKAWMKARGLRHLEPGEENNRPEPVNKEDKRRRMKYVMDNYQKRTALEVRTDA